MRAIILAAGEGYRLRPLTVHTPKVMLPVGNRPILEYVIEALRKKDVRDITLVVGYHADKIKQYFGGGRDFGVRIDYVLQKKQLGTAHALYQARCDEEFILLYGDNIIDEKCVETLLNAEKNTILASRSYRASEYGVLVREKERVVIVEKPESGEESMVFTGMGRFGPEIFDEIEKAMNEEIYDLPKVLNRNPLSIQSCSCNWMDAVFPLDLLNLNRHALQNNIRKLGGKVESATIVGNVEIGDGTVISAGAYIRGNVRIGENCFIGPNTVILGDTSIGDGASIGAQSYVENSIIMEDAQIEEGALIKNSVIGRDVSIGPRFTTVSGERDKVFGNRIYRFVGGAVVGDGAVLGAAIVVHPAVHIGSGARVSDLKVLSDDVADEESVR